jgi:plastocyanin
MKRSLFRMATAALFLLMVASCSKSDSSGTTPPPPPGGGGGGTTTGSTINITGMSFPSNTSVKKGTTVTWNNKDGMAHTVTSDNGTSFSSGNLAAGASYSYTANTVGTFDYHCDYHSGMVGKLTVTE